MSAEAGWYDDGTGKQRWWDGTRWTELYADLSGSGVELHADDTAPPASPTAPGWYDDGRGRQRWWDGHRWTTASRFTDDHQEFAGVVVDGAWIHFGDLSQPVADASASFEQGEALLRRTRLDKPAIARRLYGPRGLITPQLMKRSIGRADHFVAIDGPEQFWLAPAPAASSAEAQQFVAWINASSQHYRYRSR